MLDSRPGFSNAFMPAGNGMKVGVGAAVEDELEELDDVLVEVAKVEKDWPGMTPELGSVIS